MTIYILGGSNSLLKSGWAPAFAQSVAPEPVVNLSIGATSSYMALFRMLTCDDMRPGDVILWEYALNDAEHRYVRGVDPKFLLAGVERLLIEARRRGVRMAPLLFAAGKTVRQGGPWDHHEALIALFKHYALTPVDVTRQWAAQHGEPMSRRHFEPGLHYRSRPETREFLVTCATRALDKAAVPGEVRALRVPPETLDLATDFTTERFQNAIVDLPVAPTPLEADLSGPGRLVALFLISAPHNQTLEICLRDGEKILRERKRDIRAEARKWLLRAVHFPGDWTLPDQAQFSVRVGKSTASPRAYLRRLALWVRGETSQTEPLVVAVLISRPIE